MNERELAGQLAQLAKEYQPNQSVTEFISQRQALLIVGPTAIGKTTLIKHIEEQQDDFGIVTVFTTREARDDDGSMFRHYKHDRRCLEKLIRKAEAGELVQFAVHPTTGRVYGSETSDWSKPFNMLPTLATIVESMTTLPFKSTQVICIVTDADAWEGWFRERWMGNADPAIIRQRLAEAELSMRICRQNKYGAIYNDPTSVETGADNIIKLAHGESASTATEEQVQSLLDRIVSLQAEL